MGKETALSRKFYMTLTAIIVFGVSLLLIFPSHTMPARIRLLTVNIVDAMPKVGGCLQVKYCKKILDSFEVSDIPLIVSALRTNQTQHIDQHLCYALARLGREAHESMVVLLQHNRKQMRLAAAVALYHAEELPEEAVPHLAVALIKDKRDIYAMVLGQYGAAAKLAIPALIAHLPHGGYMAREALIAIGPAAYPELVHALGTDDIQIQVAVSEVLARIGPEVQEAIPALLEIYAFAVMNSHEALKCQIAKSIALIGTVDPDALIPLYAVFECPGQSEAKHWAKYYIEYIESGR